MKKFFALVLTFVVSISSFGLIACDSPTQSSHNFEDSWSYNETHHWKACQDDDCAEVSEKAEHEFTDDTCVCGAKKDVTNGSGNGQGGTGSGSQDNDKTPNGGDTQDSDKPQTGTGDGTQDTDKKPNGGSSQDSDKTQTSGSEISSNNWLKAFDFNNVTIKHYIIENGNKKYDSSYLFADDKLMLSAPNHESVTTDAEIIKTTKCFYDFSTCYSSASYSNGKYFIESFSPFEGIEHKNAYLTFKDGKLSTLEGNIIKNGSTDILQNYYIEFVDYDTTVIKESTGSGTIQGGSSGNQSSPSPIHPDFDGGNGSTNDKDPEKTPEKTPEQTWVYIDRENNIYHLDKNCSKSALSKRDLEDALKSQFIPCDICVK